MHPSFTKTYHHSSYPAISPSRAELSCRGKTIIITGAGQGIGAAAALSFAKAGATNIALIGRTESKLIQTQSQVKSIRPDCNVYTAVADISEPESLGLASHNIRVSLGAWDIFCHCAGIIGPLTPLTGTDIDEWWSVFETNTKFMVIFAKHFLTKCRLPGATFIYTNSRSAHASIELLPPCSAYSASKLAAARICEWLAKESPGLRVFSVHPGAVETPLATKFLANQVKDETAFDDADMAADFFVWCASAEAEFLRGRYVWANWDVEEMMQKKAELGADPTLLRLQLSGWPFV